VDLGELIGRHDVLEWLPGWLRVLIQRLITKPFIFQWLPRAQCKVTLLSDEPGTINQQRTQLTLNGIAMCELAHLNN
jgi:hypothetical protein